MLEVRAIGPDLAKQVFQAHGADASGRMVLRKTLRRGEVLRFLGDLRPCVGAMEACGGAHHWAREIGKLGHENYPKTFSLRRGRPHMSYTGRFRYQTRAVFLSVGLSPGRTILA